MKALATVSTVLLAGSLLISGAPAASAQGTGAAASSSQNSEAGTQPQPVVLVMDYSSSMLEKDADSTGTSRLDAAKTAMKDLIRATDPSSQMGLVVYGNTAAKKCDDINTIAPIGPVNQTDLVKKIDGLKAVGETPIGASLLKAADEFGNREGAKSIVLVSDGEENCSNPPACKAAEDLRDRGIDLTVHTIGFRVNSKAKSELECVAKTTGGTYSDAGSASQLAQALRTKTTRAMQGYTVGGEDVKGGLSRTDAPTVLPGIYADAIPTSGERPQVKPGERVEENGNYRVYKTIVPEGYLLNVSATLVTPRAQSNNEPNGYIEVLSLPFDREPGCNGRAYREIAVEEVRPYPTTSLRFSVAADCRSDNGEQYFAITRVNPVGNAAGFRKDEPLDIEFTVALEPDSTPPSRAARPTAPSQEEILPAVEPSNPTQLAGGGSFNDAPQLTSAQTISDSVVAGEKRYFRIPASYGQNVAFNLTAKGTPEKAKYFGIAFFNALRERPMVASLDNWTNGMTAYAKFGVKDGDLVTGNLRHSIDPVFRVTHAFQEERRALGVGGDIYAVVYRNFEAGTGDEELPFELTMSAVGNATTGPEFMMNREQFAAKFPDIAADPSLGAPQGTASAAHSAPASSVASTGASSAATTESASASGNNDDASPLPWVLGGAGLAALIGGGIWFARRQRSETLHDRSQL